MHRAALSKHLAMIDSSVSPYIPVVQIILPAYYLQMPRLYIKLHNKTELPHAYNLGLICRTIAALNPCQMQPINLSLYISLSQQMLMPTHTSYAAVLNLHY